MSKSEMRRPPPLEIVPHPTSTEKKDTLKPEEHPKKIPALHTQTKKMINPSNQELESPVFDPKFFTYGTKSKSNAKEPPKQLEELKKLLEIPNVDSPPQMNEKSEPMSPNIKFMRIAQAPEVEEEVELLKKTGNI